MTKKRILSGIQPTGRLHLGNLIGAVANWVKLQDEYEAFYEIADLHALTSIYDDTTDLPEDTFQLAVDLLAAGIDPNKATLFIQSQVPEHSQLHLLLSMITPLPWLERVPTYKGKIEEMTGQDLSTYGFLGYPVLQAADILIYKADVVPVGKDQVPHIEFTREIARRFNSFYGEIFPIPQEKLTEVPVLPGLDGRKMSKSYNNTIALADSSDEIRKKVASMITDPARRMRNDPGHPEVCAAFQYHKIYSAVQLADIAQKCQAAGIGCVECKKDLADNMMKALEPILERRKDLVKSPDKVKEILQKGTAKAKIVASQTMAEINQAVRLT